MGSIPFVTSLQFKLLVTILLILLIGASALWNITVIKHHVTDMAINEARGIFSLIIMVREWNSSHGGVYVPIDDKTAPNPYLKIVDRDIELNGHLYTKMNPSFMTREIADISKAGRGIMLRMTSLNPINPVNAADDWEKVPLQAFQHGLSEYSSFVSQGEELRFRYIAPLYTSKDCLVCHAGQGYRIGDVQGAITVSMPGKPMTELVTSQQINMVIIHSAVFLSFSGMLWWFLGRLKRNWQNLKQYEEQIEYQAYHDQLTGLPNRRMYEQYVSQALERVKRNRESLAIVFLDLDAFKNVNDALGHIAGDVLLQEVAERIRRVLRKGDIAARMGGDEFMILLSNLEAHEAAFNVAERILIRLAEPYQIQTKTVFVTASLGIAFFPEDGEDARTLMKNADIALYRSKEGGRNQWTSFSNSDQEAQ